MPETPPAAAARPTAPELAAWLAEHSPALSVEPEGDFMTEYLYRVARTIGEYGYAVQPVVSDGHSAPYSYTIGLHQSHGYELVMTGLGHEVANGVLHRLVDRFKDSTGPASGVSLDGVLAGGFQVRMRRVESLENFSLHRAIFGDDSCPPYWQVVWPDAAGVFPTDLGCSISPEGQPLL
ncbi:DUF4262 domain-containing protein [Actinacidiphila sp. ITFR-21]|uniref:DUF4262 domain-containing protein n=1 Tax=Actinacidiphila sp. ITFR-21 TaxID=3075199 RepID=UPI00288B1DF8|nr:DUF4262 domain-containing protein [Streptomyces sp. ITFR-21]WNI19985.1 DUF4262 domain-containing protein [Streptomyces sp. ITFR-21]